MYLYIHYIFSPPRNLGTLCSSTKKILGSISMIVLHTSLSADLSLLILNPDQVGYKGHRNIFQCYNLTFIQPHIQTIGYKKHLHFYAVYPWDI